MPSEFTPLVDRSPKFCHLSALASCWPLSIGVGALIVSVLPTVLLGVCFLWVARAVPVVERRVVNRQDLLDLLHAWRHRSGLRIIGMICLYNMALIAMFSMIPLYLATVHGLEPTTIGIIFATLMVTGALAQPWVGKLSDSVGRRPVLLTAHADRRCHDRSAHVQPGALGDDRAHGDRVCRDGLDPSSDVGHRSRSLRHSRKHDARSLHLC